MSGPTRRPEAEHFMALVEEYKVAAASREHYMKAYIQTNFYFGLIVGAFGAGIWKFEWLLLLVPFLIIIQYGIVQWNQYHSFLAEVFLAQSEKKINKLVNEDCGSDPHLCYFTYYNHLFMQGGLIKSKAHKLPMIKPTAFLAISLSVVNLAILTYSMWGSYRLLETLPYGFWIVILYFILVLLPFFLLVYNYIRTASDMKPILLNNYYYC